MPGPAPKAPSARARRNKKSTAANLAAVPDGDVVVPGLPPRRVQLEDDEGYPYWTEDAWRPETLQWWADLWASPMSAEYHSSDRHALFVLAVLIDDFWRRPDQKLAAEIRMQRQAFGLTPVDRRRLDWVIDQGEEAQDRTEKRRNAKAETKRKNIKAVPDPRKALG